MNSGNQRSGGSQIFCLSWVKRGVAKTNPDVIKLSSTELNAFRDGGCDGDESENEVEQNQVDVSSKQDDITNDELEEYDLGNYDEDEGDFQGINGLYVYSKNADDPYINKNEDGELADSDDEKEKMSMSLKPDDNLLLCARCSQHTSTLEVFVYNHVSKDFYVHHDIPLMETPLCMQWVGFDPGESSSEAGNLVALGNFNSTIDIWDLDITNTLEPVFTIGQNCNMSKKKSRKKEKFLHSDAILDLSWSGNVKDVLASASADSIVALWDLEMGVATNLFSDHSDKVQSLEWQPHSVSNLCSGSFDGNIFLLDKKSDASTAGWKVEGEVERISWNSLDANFFAASTDRGITYYFDCRKPNHLLKWQAHEQPVPCLSIFSSESKFFLCSASSDGFAKIWNLEDTDENIPSLMHSKDIKIGMVHCMQANPDEKFVIACGGQKDAVKVWDMAQTNEISSLLDIPQSTAGFDTLKPEGGGGDDDDDVVKYVAGEDYINPNKSGAESVKKHPATKKRRKKKKPKETGA